MMIRHRRDSEQRSKPAATKNSERGDFKKKNHLGVKHWVLIVFFVTVTYATNVWRLPEIQKSPLKVDLPPACLKATHSTESLWITVSTACVVDGIDKVLDSIEIQKQLPSTNSYEEIRVVVFGNVAQRNSKPNVTYIQNHTSNMTCEVSERNLYEYVRKHALPHEYVWTLQGAIVGTDIVEQMYEFLAGNKPWLVESIRIVQSHMLHHLQRHEPFSKLSQLAGPDRIIHEPPRFIRKKQNMFSFLRRHKVVWDKRKPNSPLPEVIHVIACVFDRNNTETFLSRLASSELKQDQSLSISICNNNHARQDELHEIARNVSRRHANVSISIHDMGENHRGYSRFLLAKRMMQTDFVDYVIMVDDDQFVLKETIGQVWNSRRPLTYSTWYGKSWDHSVSRPVHSYWKPTNTIPMRPMNASKHMPHINRWHYGGTGMSIIDASIFLKKELYQLPEKFLFVEDVWLSYLVQISTKWNPIGRLFVRFEHPSTDFRLGTDQWKDMKPLKQEFFASLAFLGCDLHKKMPS